MSPQKTVRPAIEQFAREMERQLRENDHKGGWTNDSAAALLSRLREETDELEEAIRRTTGAQGEVALDGSYASPLWWMVVEEAADVANFALMLADLAMRGGVHGLADLARLRERMELDAA